MWHVCLFSWYRLHVTLGIRPAPCPPPMAPSSHIIKRPLLYMHLPIAPFCRYFLGTYIHTYVWLSGYLEMITSICQMINLDRGGRQVTCVRTMQIRTKKGRTSWRKWKGQRMRRRRRPWALLDPFPLEYISCKFYNIVRQTSYSTIFPLLFEKCYCMCWIWCTPPHSTSLPYTFMSSSKIIKKGTRNPWISPNQSNRLVSLRLKLHSFKPPPDHLHDTDFPPINPLTRHSILVSCKDTSIWQQKHLPWFPPLSIFFSLSLFFFK